jgi:hypothetical protein
MEMVNNISKRVAKSLELLKGYIAAVEENEVWETYNVTEAVKLLEEALEMLVEKPKLK